MVLYDRVIKDYPQWPKLVDTYYLKAMTVEELGKKADAKLAYEEVIKRYPDHQFAKDAAQMIDNMQYTPEESIEKWRMQNELEAKGRPADPLPKPPPTRLKWRLKRGRRECAEGYTQHSVIPRRLCGACPDKGGERRGDPVSQHWCCVIPTQEDPLDVRTHQIG